MNMTKTLIALTVLLPALVDAQPARPPTPSELIVIMKQRGPASWDDETAAQLRAAFAAERLIKHGTIAVAELTALWAVDAPDSTAPPRVVSEDGRFSLPLTRVGTSTLYAGLAELADPTVMRWFIDVGGRRIGGEGLDVYARHSDERVRAGVPKGTLTQMPAWRSKVFEGTTRDWWVYVPSQARRGARAAVMVFQDGEGYKEYVPTVFDNLIHTGDMPVAVGIFISPGVRADGSRNRSFEYDTLSPQYVTFLVDEILPEVEKMAALRADPQGRAIVGASSGGICAFTAAWERPDQFGNVISWIGSFTNIASGKSLREGGHNYPALIRKTPKKPIRVFLQDGANDLDNVHGSWPLANQQMAKALAFMGYDQKFVFGEGFHSHRHGRSIFPDTLRWLWRDHKDTKTQ